MRDADAAASGCSELKALGVRIAIDDFGTGYSSLAYLRQFPVDALKIDRSFISAIASSSESKALIHTLVQLGKTLGSRDARRGHRGAIPAALPAARALRLGPGIPVRPPARGRRDRSAATNHPAAPSYRTQRRRMRLNGNQAARWCGMRRLAEHQAVTVELGGEVVGEVQLPRSQGCAGFSGLWPRSLRSPRSRRACEKDFHLDTRLILTSSETRRLTSCPARLCPRSSLVTRCSQTRSAGADNLSSHAGRDDDCFADGHTLLEVETGGP